jgi:hypothetical protein
MKRLSSFWTPLSKRLLPAGLIAAFAIGAISAAASGIPLFKAFLGFCGAAGFILFLQKTLASDLADEVIDLGDSLLVRRGTVKDKILLVNLMKIDEAVGVSPPRMTIHFVKRTAFGNSVTFSPISSRHFNPRHSLAEELMLRAQKAREQNAT